MKIAKVLVFLFSLAPFVWLALAFLSYPAVGALAPIDWIPAIGPNIVEDIRNITGEWTLRFLVATLVITPLRQLTGWNGAMRFRRMFGLFAFFYSSVHFITYLALDKACREETCRFPVDLGEVLKDFSKRPFITAGIISFALMLPLAVTSTRKWISRLGGKRWQALHRLVYFSAIAGVVHYYWKGKQATVYPLVYAAVFVLLLGYRGWIWMRKRGVMSRPAT